MPPRASNAPSLKGIAKRLKLAPSTVTRALNDHPHISKRTKDRVRHVAHQVGYVADTAARLLRGSDSNLVGLLVANIDSPFYAPMANELARCFNLHGYQLTLGITGDEPELEYRHLHSLVANRAAGVVIVPSYRPTAETFVLLQRLPYVQLARRLPRQPADSFLLDEQRAFFDATMHLLTLGHRRIAFVGAPIASLAGARRYGGFYNAMKEADAPVDPRLVLETPIYGAAESTKELFLAFYADQRPTGVIGSRTRSTAGIAQAIDALKLAVPDQISFVGFGDPLWPRWWRSGLTTLQLPIKEIALASGERLIERIHGDSDTLRAKHVMLQCPLLVRL